MWGGLNERFRGRGRVNFYKNFSLVLRLSLCNFRDLIYAQSASNTPKRKENLKSHHMTPLIQCLFNAGAERTSRIKGFLENLESKEKGEG